MVTGLHITISVWNVGKPTVTDQTSVGTKKSTIKKDSINGIWKTFYLWVLPYSVPEIPERREACEL